MPQESTIRWPRPMALGVLGLALGGAASTPGGCNSHVKESGKIGIYQCDTAPGGTPDCADADRIPGNATPEPGCPPSNGPDLYCGYCQPTHGCRYCPEDSFCPLDPCGSLCPTRISYTVCPDDFPIACGEAACCPRGYPSCCRDSKWCGASAAACWDEVDGPSQGTTSTGGSGCDVEGGCTGGMFPASARTGCCWNNGIGDCLDGCSDGCGYAWYELDGVMYGPCEAGDSACLSEAATRAYANCT